MKDESAFSRSGSRQNLGNVLVMESKQSHFHVLVLGDIAQAINHE